jgi:hypothetical protein
MSPALVASSDVMEKTDNPRKRASSATSELPVAKKPRTLSFRSLDTPETDGAARAPPKIPTTAELARAGLRRGITLALKQVGFESASAEAMESFTAITETCKIFLTLWHVSSASNTF